MSHSDFNFVRTCFESGFPNICYFAYFNLLLGFACLCLNTFAFIRMTNFYRKINFENMIMLLSLIQITIFLIHMFLIIRIILYVFTFLQTVVICLINIKFTKTSKGMVEIKFEWINILILVINAIYLIGLIVIYYLEILSEKNRYPYYAYYLIELCASIILTIYCCKFLNIIKKKLYHSKEKTEGTGGTLEQESETKTSSKHEHIKNNIYLFRYDYQDNSELFYSFKKKQLTFLYLSNIICTVVECATEVGLLICIESSLNIIQLITYIHFLVTLFHNIIIFFAFFWIVRNNFNINKQVVDNTNSINEEGLIDDNFIEQEVKKIETQNIGPDGDKNNDDKVNKKTTYLTDDFE